MPLVHLSIENPSLATIKKQGSNQVNILLLNFKSVETVGELGVLNYLKKISKGASPILLIDTHSSPMAAKGTIPSAMNLHGDKLIVSRGANSIAHKQLMP